MNSKKIKTKPSAKYPEGRDLFFPIFDSEFEALMSPTSMDDPGFCLGCGEEARGVEPDAHHYPCENCDQRLVFGLEELLLRGLIAYPETPVTTEVPQ